MENYRLSVEAKEDLRRIYKYGAEKYGEKQAAIYVNALFDRFEHIAKNPFLYQLVDYIYPGYRRSVCGVDSIFYLIKDNVAEIIAIVGRQDIENAFSNILPQTKN